MDVQVYEANAFTLFGMVVTQRRPQEVYGSRWARRADASLAERIG